MARFGFWKCWTLITFFCWRGDVGHPSALLFLYLSLNNFQSFCLVAFCIISNAGAERNDSSWSCHFNSSKISVHYLEFNIHQMDHNTFILEILHQNNDVYFRDSIMYMAYKFQHGERNTNSRLFFFFNTHPDEHYWPDGLVSGVLLQWMSTWHYVLKFWESRKGRIAVEEYL